MPHPSLTCFGYQTTPFVLSSHRLLISAGSVQTSDCSAGCYALRCMSVLACVCEPIGAQELSETTVNVIGYRPESVCFVTTSVIYQLCNLHRRIAVAAAMRQVRRYRRHKSALLVKP